MVQTEHSQPLGHNGVTKPAKFWHRRKISYLKGQGNIVKNIIAENCPNLGRDVLIGTAGFENSKQTRPESNIPSLCCNLTTKYTEQRRDIENGKREAPNCIQRQAPQNNIRFTNGNFKSQEGLKDIFQIPKDKLHQPTEQNSARLLVIIERETKLSMVKN